MPISLPHTASILEDEEKSTTIQIGFVGTDGLVLASDTKWTLRQKLEGADVRAQFSGSKIRLNPAKTVAIACAGHMGSAWHVAEAILSDSDLEKENDLDVRSRRIKVLGIANSGNGQPQCIVMFSRPAPCIFLFENIADHGADCVYVPLYTPSGDALNTALFWLHYYELMPIKQLKRLAAHLIVAAGELNSGYISGLEMVCCSNGVFERCSDNENHAYETQARQWDKQIGSLILGYGKDAL